MTEQPGLPGVAAARIDQARAGHTWSSSLSVDEFAAIRSAGFEPVGQVMGSSVFRTSVNNMWVDCGYRRGLFGMGDAHTITTADRGVDNGYHDFVRGRYQMRHLAMSRMADECRALGGHGVVATRLTMHRFEGDAFATEYRAIGTAVAVPGAVQGPRPFLSHVTGQEFAQLYLAGYIPVDLVFGVAIGVRHDDYATRSSTGWFAGNQEVPGWTELLARTRHVARANFHTDAARTGGDGLLVSTSELTVSERECRQSDSARDHVAEAMFLGTSIARFGGSRAHRGPKPLTIMRLDRARS